MSADMEKLTREVQRLRRDVAELKNAGRADVMRIPIGGAGGGLDIQIVTELPAIPSGPTLILLRSVSAPPGDPENFSASPHYTDTLWFAHADSIFWVPIGLMSDVDGRPGSISDLSDLSI